MVTAMVFVVFSSTASAAPPEYGVASWPESGHGSHRAVVRVSQPADAVWAHIEWRRRDPHPETKDIRIFDAATGQRITNVASVTVTREFGDLVFQPQTVPGEYHVYYLPYDPPGTGPFGEGGSYFAPQDPAAPAWVAKHGLTPGGLPQGEWRRLPRAELVGIQARNEFSRMDPMEVIATREETDQLLARHPNASYLLFPEDREHPIRMFEDLPYRWIERGPSTAFAGDARPGEYYTFQIGVFAARRPIEELALRFTDFSAANGSIPAAECTCLNLAGTDWLGRPMTKTFEVGEGKTRPLWIGVPIPRDADGTYEGTIAVQPTGGRETSVRVSLSVSGPVMEDAGDGELWRMSRLRWLDSTLGIDEEVIPPFTPLEVNGDRVECLGRAVNFGKLGLPERIRSNGRPVLAGPMQLVVETETGPLAWEPGATRVTERTPATVERIASARAGGARLSIAARMEFDGCLAFRATLRAERLLKISDTRLEVPLARDVARYMMGLGKRGGYRPAEWRWQWNADRANNMVWLGDADAGLQLKLSGDQDAWQVTDLRETGLPASWHNDGKGGCEVAESGEQVLVRAYTGARTLAEGEELTLRFRLLLTPFKPIDPEHWNWRYGDVRADGNIQHVHHGVMQNPYINYPFHTADAMKELVDDVRAIRTRQLDFGELTYPAAGNIDPERGALHVWARVNFDPTAGQPRQAQYNQGLFSLDFPNEDSLGFYWNIDDRGMRTYVRSGPPADNKYPILFGTHQPDWEQGQRHLVTLSWGDRLAIYIDGKLAGAAPYQGTVATPIEGAVLRFSGGFALDAINVTGVPYGEGTGVEPSPDDHTLLLDTFADWDGSTRTRPEVIGSGGAGTVTGICEKKTGQDGAELAFACREVETHPKGVNIYYTVRELSDQVAEMWALRSLGDEVFRTGGVSIYSDPDPTAEPCLGYAWLREHLVTGYEPAWRSVLPNGELDAAIQMQGLSRWHNYYVEGLNWLMRNTGVDGLYLDGIGYDREIMKRVAKVMQRANPNYRINFHSGDNWSPPWDPDRLCSPANSYMEHFPYISNLWFGELYDYNMPPDYWLVEISGIPFGLTGEMLNYQNGGNPYRGMVYGMSGRQHPSAPAMWRFWDEFGIQGAEMIGYWRDDCPVRTSRDDVLATVYRKPGKTLVALARWPEERALPSAFIREAAARPTIDGTLSAGEWDAAAKLASFRRLQSDDLAAEQTEVYVTYDAERLYIGFHCAQSAGPKAEVSERDGPVWEDDAMEVFIRPDVTQRRYLQFVGNSGGAFADGDGMELTWNGEWIYRASVGEGHWEGELSIPFASLGMGPPAEGTEIGFNACRDQQRPRPELSCWSPVTATFHEPDHFGRLVCSTREPVAREKLAGTEENLAQVRLQIDWKALGLDPAKVRLVAPAIEHFQVAASFAPDAPVPVEEGKGWLLVLEEGDGG